MKVGSFEVRVSNGIEERDGTVRMSHNTEYSLTLRNNTGRDADATIYIDGKRIDTFRVKRHGVIRVERPTNERRRFKFVAVGTHEAREAQLDEYSNDLGLITVEFRTGTPRAVPYTPPVQPLRDSWDWLGAEYERGTPISYGARGMSMSSGGQRVNCSTRSVGAGGTGLGGHSTQNFRTVESLAYDGRITKVNLRLVEDQFNTPQTAVLRSNEVSNPIPARPW